VLGFIEFAGAHQIDDGVGCLGEIVLFLQASRGCSSFFMAAAASALRRRRRRSARAQIASSFGKHSGLYLFPLPQGRDRMRPGFSHVRYGQPRQQLYQERVGHVRLYTRAAQ